MKKVFGLSFALSFVITLSAFAQPPGVNKAAVEAFNKGVSEANKRNFKESISFYSKAIELDPKHANALHNRGIIFLNQRKQPEAIADFTALININSKDQLQQNNMQQLFDLFKNLNH